MGITKISIRIIALFTCAILMSFMPEQFPDFFGDWTCNANPQLPCFFADTKAGGHITPELHWGYRHFLFFAMGLVLFAIQTIDIINQANK